MLAPTTPSCCMPEPSRTSSRRSVDRIRRPICRQQRSLPLLDQLHVWEILERSYDGTRAATLAEYRNRHFVYQFGQAGYQVYRSVEDVLAARLDSASLSRLALPDLLADMSELAEANRSSDGDLIFRKLKRLDSTLSDMADRAAHFLSHPRRPRADHGDHSAGFPHAQGRTAHAHAGVQLRSGSLRPQAQGSDRARRIHRGRSQ